MNNYTGWICARCSKSNAPHVNSCDCVPTYGTTPYYPYVPFPYQPYQPIIPFPFSPYPFDITITSMTPWIPSITDYIACDTTTVSQSNFGAQSMYNDTFTL